MPTLVQQKRKEKGLTAIWVAKKACISPSKLSKIEHGRLALKVSDLAKLARALGCAPIDLIDPENNEEPIAHTALTTTECPRAKEDEHA